jgi:mannitol/fructose-specific phosphotransferase system IIA component
LDKAIHQAKLGEKDKCEALKNLSKVSIKMEKGYTPSNYFNELVQRERDTSYKYGGKTVFGDAKKPTQKPKDGQLRLF